MWWLSDEKAANFEQKYQIVCLLQVSDYAFDILLGTYT
jgi:hypothetical protein